MEIESTSFRVKVLMNEFFTDHRNRAYITIDRSWSTVEDLHNHLKSLFNIRKFHLTTEDGFWFPPDENIRIIATHDVLIAHPSKENVFQPIYTPPLSTVNAAMDIADEERSILTPNFRKFVQEFCDKTNLNETIDLIQKPERKRIRTRKRKRKTVQRDIGEDSKIVRLEIRQGTNVVEETQPIQEVSINTSFDSNEHTGNGRMSKKCSKWIEDINILGITEPIVDSTIENRASKRLSKRNKKGKEHGVDDSFLNLTKPSLHIRFSDTEDDDDDDDDDNEDRNVEDSTTNLPPMAREIQASCIEIDIKTMNPCLNNAASIVSCDSSETIENAPTIEPELDEWELIENNNCPIESNTNIDNTCAVENAMMTNEKFETLRKNIGIMELNSIVGTPNENDCIAFKMLKMLETSEPELSEFIIAKVKMVVDDLVTLVVMAGIDQINEFKDQLDIQMENDEHVIVLKSNLFIDTKLVNVECEL